METELTNEQIDEKMNNAEVTTTKVNDLIKRVTELEKK